MKRIGNIYGPEFGTGYAGNVWDSDAICPTLMSMQGGGRQPHVLEIKNVSNDCCNERSRQNEPESQRKSQ